MIKFSTLILIFGLVLNCCAQNLTLELGKSYTPDATFQPLKILGEIDESVILVRSSLNKKTGLIQSIKIEEFGTSTLALKNSKQFDEMFSNLQANYPEDIAIWNNQVCLFSSGFNKKTKAYELKMKALNASLEPDTSRVLMTSQTDEFDLNEKRFSLSVSSNRKFLSAFRIFSSAISQSNDIQLIRYDSLFKVVSETDAHLPFKGSNIEVINELTDNSGNLHLLIRAEQDSIYKYSVLAFPLFGSELVEYNLEIPGKNINSASISINEDDKLLVGGFFSDEFDKKSRNRGVFFLRIDRETGEIEMKGLNRFNQDFLSFDAGEDLNQDLTVFEGYNQCEIIPKGKNSALLIVTKLEEEQICEEDYRNGLLICKDVFRHGNTMIISLNDQANPDWFRVLNHDESSTNDGGKYIGNVIIENSSSGIFLLNNITPEGKQPYALSSRNISLLANYINSNGQLKITSLPQAEDISILPYTFYETEKKASYLLAEEAEKAKLIRLKP